ncbi:MAG: hypothetical protein PHO37_11410, partial [Kiritimatiellae bacterium]|nr:hypothetical protein [Kiritimatiellia bacterium]
MAEIQWFYLPANYALVGELAGKRAEPFDWLRPVRDGSAYAEASPCFGVFFTSSGYPQAGCSSADPASIRCA